MLPSGEAFGALQGLVGENLDAAARSTCPSRTCPNNVQRIGVALVADYPVSLELAGVILTLAMFGAVVLARKQIEIGEDDVREAAGMPRLGLEDDHAGGDA